MNAERLTMRVPRSHMMSTTLAAAFCLPSRVTRIDATSYIIDDAPNWAPAHAWLVEWWERENFKRAGRVAHERGWLRVPQQLDGVAHLVRIIDINLVNPAGLNP